uniref:Uncharacterized protein n=1 Tax=Glossina pallidipes TaxID=7398 RepID=A0A1A9ZUR6_GLOPL
MTSTLCVSLVNSLRGDEVQGCLGEFDFDITGSIQEMRRRRAQFINKDRKPEVVARLLELQTKLEALTRQRSPSPASHARNTSDDPSTNEKEPLQPPTSAENLCVPATIPEPTSTIVPAFYSNVSALVDNTSKITQLAAPIGEAHPVSRQQPTRGHRNSQQMGT